ncbi:MAG: endopeptidase La [Clostridia bacterium]|nr:endopeptidase La [Clostridia bacterium]
MILAFVPLRGITIFPRTMVTFDVGRDKSIKAVDYAMENGKLLFVSSQKDEDVLEPSEDDYYSVGTVVRIKQILKTKDNVQRLLVEGLYRAEIINKVQDAPFLQYDVRELEEIPVSQEDEIECEAIMNLIVDVFDKNNVFHKEDKLNDMIEALTKSEDAAFVADTLASHTGANIETRQELLETLSVMERIKRVYDELIHRNQVLAIEAQIAKEAQESMDESHKEYVLREHLKAIQKELGYGEEISEEIEKWTARLAELNLPERTTEKIRKEIVRYGKMQPMSPDSNVSRTYIETILDLPWDKFSETNSNLELAESILNSEHYGLEKVKERILEYLAVLKLTDSIKGPILCLVGPPGVGKTSIAKSLAHASGREFVRMSLGGVSDEAEIRGHRRTYIGAIPGRVISLIQDANVSNPLILFDEIDKLGADYKGDPSSALLEVLDPEQNKDFTDHYLEIPFDLSKVMFVTTANSLDTIPEPLLDRMEIIEVQGYTKIDKLAIAKEYLVPKQIKENGLNSSIVRFNKSGLECLIDYYTRESGVRGLEKKIASICRKVARKYAIDDNYSVSINAKEVEEFLGKKLYHFDKIEGKSEVGVTCGMAWTQVGGDTLFIEVSKTKGDGKIQLTGQLGDVMQESAKAALTYVKSIADQLKIDPEVFKNYDLHVHVPEGAVPKDGPSAGVTIFTTIVSCLTDVAVKKDVAMTGEITLRGNILPVGGIREKVLAAHRAGIKKILLPKDNEVDIDDIPESARKDLEFVLLEKATDALKEALVK